MNGVIVLPYDANGNQQSVALASIQSAWAVTTGVQGASANSVALNISVQSSGGSQYVQQASSIFTFGTAATATSIATLINSLINSQSNSVTYIFDDPNVYNAEWPTVPVISSFSINNSGTSNCYVALVINGISGGGNIGSPAWSNFAQAAFVILDDGTLLTVNPADTTAILIQTFPINATTTAAHATILDSNQIPIAYI